ncbi:UNVERIFIED_CONTAM: tRNA wybutosine-synthesizing protein 2/3/4 [Sesamum calycinum]|uniref:tRNA wybutosine-synthesizing protein 2/3/4 n=1 Tax=Sesamum calycinum TaxID=2727403 RepID=A0AAW2Q5Z9_9LAMI
MEFQKRKSAALAAMNSPAPDKSPKGNPTASPSASKKKARGGSWLFVSHDPVNPSSLSTLLFPPSPTPTQRDSAEEPRLSESIVFRFEPLIIAVECENVDAAQSLVSLAISCGFRESGITSVSKRVIIAIRCSIRLEVPLGDTKRLMVSPEYVEYLVEVANEKMGANRKRTDLFLIKLINNSFAGHEIRVNGEMSSDPAETLAEANKLGFSGSPVENGVKDLEAELGSESKHKHHIDDGSMEVVGISLSALEIVGEPVERLFLWGHSACTLNQKKIIIFGGFGGIGRHARRNDLLLLDTESGVMETIAATGAPSPRLGHTSSVIGDFIYVIGGRADPMNILNEVWVFSNAKKEWKLLPCSGTLFRPRHRHTAAVVGSKIYVFGGIDNDAVLSSLYVFDTDTFEWSEIEIQGDQPGPRHSHSMDASGSKLYIFGGYNGEKALGDLYSFDIKTGLWRKLKANGQPPNARFSHLMFIYSNHLGIFGGCPVSDHQKLSLFDLQSESWKNIVVKPIEEGLFVRSTANVFDDDLIIIGGGASCYAFGTKFSEPMKINLLQLMSSRDNTVPTAIGEKHVDYQTEQKSNIIQHSQNVNEQKVIAHNDLDSEFEEPMVASGGLDVGQPCVLRLEKQYAKLGKDILKKFGWLDLDRKVYSQADGMHICLPINEKFCTIFEDKQDLGDKFEPLTDFQSLKPSTWQIWLEDISSSAAMNLLMTCRANKIVDKVMKVKKTPISPFKVMKDAVATLLNHHDLPSELLEQLPSRWERLGDIIVLPVFSFKDQVWDSIGKELWPLVAESLGTHRLARQVLTFESAWYKSRCSELTLKTFLVLGENNYITAPFLLLELDQGRVAQTGTRDSKLEILVGDNGWVDHRENGVLYSFDATKCMFSWGNLSEKLRMAHLDCKDQVIVDLFAGIGYFVLPFLVRANAKMVYACEWNPHAIEALRHNLEANSVADRCVVMEGDNRVTAPKGVADRVCLGLLPSSECSWVTAVRALRDEGGMLHIHGNAKDTEEGLWTKHVVQSISDIVKSEGRSWEVLIDHVERVKWYAPHIRHLVVDVRCKRTD